MKPKMSQKWPKNGYCEQPYSLKGLKLSQAFHGRQFRHENGWMVVMVDVVVTELKKFHWPNLSTSRFLIWTSTFTCLVGLALRGNTILVMISISHYLAF